MPLKALPTYNLKKDIHSRESFEYRPLEKAYNPYDTTNAHRHDYYELIIFDASGGYHEIDFNTYTVKKQTIHFITPGKVHLLRRKANVTGHVFAFKEELLLQNSSSFTNDFLFFSANTDSVISADTLTFRKIKFLADQLISEFNSNHLYKNYVLGSFLVILLIEIMKINKGSGLLKKNSGQKTYENFRKLLDKNVLSNSGVSEYASMLNITAGHLNDIVRNESGKMPVR